MVWPSLEATSKTITVARNFVFITLGTLNRPDLHFEGAGNGPVFITWIGRGHELYSGAPHISLVELCITFRHDRRLISLLGFVHNWPTSRWSATKKENRFSLNGNRNMSFLGRQFYRSTLYKYIHHHHYYHQVTLSVRSLTPSLSPSLSGYLSLSPIISIIHRVIGLLDSILCPCTVDVKKSLLVGLHLRVDVQDFISSS